VTVIGADPERRRRLADVLAGVPGVTVVGWADSVDSLVAFGAAAASDLGLVVDGPETTELPTAGRQPLRPRLSPRQRHVLIAYTAGNELTPVVARGLGINKETLKTHLRRIRAKYREVGRPAPTRRDLYVRAVEDGLLPPPS
jgi:DNA-binding CsgD family transcriptional regulator